MRMSPRQISNILLILLITAVGAHGTETSDYDDERSRFVVGNIVFVLLHEFGHLVIDDFEIPVLGNSEDAADTLAAVTLIRLDRARPEADFAYVRMLVSAADANRILWETGLERDTPDSYGARHPLSVQRVARIACLVYGSDVETFAPLANHSYLPDFRADWCDYEFEQAEQAWEWVRDKYVRKAERRETEHTASYGNTKDPALAIIRERLLAAKGLERALAIVEESVFLPDTIRLRTRSCGTPNAYWDANERELVLCYELVQAFDNLSNRQKISELEQHMRAFHRRD